MATQPPLPPSSSFCLQRGNQKLHSCDVFIFLDIQQTDERDPSIVWAACKGLDPIPHVQWLYVLLSFGRDENIYTMLNMMRNRNMLESKVGCKRLSSYLPDVLWMDKMDHETHLYGHMATRCTMQYYMWLPGPTTDCICRAESRPHGDRNARSRLYHNALASFMDRKFLIIIWAF